MKILITGSSGFVGKYLVARLSKKNTIVKYDLTQHQDILNEGLLVKKLKGVDVVVHLAAFVSAEESWLKPKEYFMNNAIGTLSVINCCIKSKTKKIIFFSSAAVKSKPLTPYGLSKKMAEEIIKLYKDKLDVTILRPENIYGLGQKSSQGHVVDTFINSIKKDEVISIYGDGMQSRDFIYIDDVTTTVDSIIIKKKYGLTINLGTGKSIRIKDLAVLISKLINRILLVKYLNMRVEPRKSVANTKKLYLIGVDPDKFVTLEEGIKMML